MIGHYVNQLTAEEEDVLLGARLGYAPGFVNSAAGCKCIRGALMFRDSGEVKLDERHLLRWYGPNGSPSVAVRWDCLCYRFGDARIANATRGRILENRARRVLSLETVVSELEQVRA